MNKLLRPLYCIVGVIIIISCNNHKQEILNKITNNDYKYWDIYCDSAIGVYEKPVDYLKKTKPYYSIYFNKEGRYLRCKNKYVNDTISERIEDRISDVLLPNKWEYRNDSTLTLNDVNYSILKIKNDTFIYVNAQKLDTSNYPRYAVAKLINDMVILVKSESQRLCQCQ